jgi:hypothetical protein
MTRRPSPFRASVAATLLASGALALAGCGTLDDFLPGSRGHAPDRPGPVAADPPATEAGICDLAKAAVREATGLRVLRGETCTAARTRPGEWAAEVGFTSGSEQQAYRITLQPTRQRQGWAAVDVTPQAAAG